MSFSGPVAGETWPPGWSPVELPEPAATAVREEPVLAEIAVLTTVHRLHGEDGTTVTRGHEAGIAYLEQRALQSAAARVAAARESAGS